MMSEEKFLTRLANSLSSYGRQTAPSSGELPDNQIPALNDMMKDLICIDDLTWGKYAFSRDILIGKFKPEDILDLTVLSNECGKEYANKIIQKYGTDKATKLAEACGLTIDYPQLPNDKTRVVFALFTPPKSIHIIGDSLEKTKELLENDETRQILSDPKIADILIAHELFHFIEEEYQQEIFTKVKKIELWALGPLKNSSTIRSLSEIAAMSFSKQINRLPFSPFMLDVFMVYGYSKTLSYRLYEEIMGFSHGKKFDSCVTEREG